jgi:hypothetical protein
MSQTKPLLCLLLLTLLIWVTVHNVSAKAPEKTSLEIQAVQTQTFDTTKPIAFAATLSVFQDLGYIIGSADLETGFITASSPTKTKRGAFQYLSNNQTKVTAFVEGFPNGKTKVRINLVNLREKQYGSGIVGKVDTIVEDPQAYETAFQKIQEAIFLRTPMTTDKE